MAPPASNAEARNAVLRKTRRLGSARSRASSHCAAGCGRKHLLLTEQRPGLAAPSPAIPDSKTSSEKARVRRVLSGKFHVAPKSTAETPPLVSWPPTQSVISKKHTRVAGAEALAAASAAAALASEPPTIAMSHSTTRRVASPLLLSRAAAASARKVGILTYSSLDPT